MRWFLHLPAPQLKQAIDGLPPVAKDLAQLLPAESAGPHDLAQSHTLARQICGNRTTEELISIEDADFTHIPRVEANCDFFSNVGRKSRGQIA
jgi:hypothetical protein